MAWGCIGISFAFINSRAEFYALRLLLGIAEAASFPGAWYYISTFIPNDHLTVALAPVELAIIAAQCVSAPLALLVFKLDGFLGLLDWQWLFLLEGIAPTILGLCMIFVLPSNVDHVSSLTKDEAQALKDELKFIYASTEDPNAPPPPTFLANLKQIFLMYGLQYITILSTLR